MPKPLYDTLFSFYIPKTSSSPMTKPVSLTQLSFDTQHDYYFYVIANSAEEVHKNLLQKLKDALAPQSKKGIKISIYILGVVPIPSVNEFIDSDATRPAVIYHEICIRSAALLTSCELRQLPNNPTGKVDWNFNKAYNAFWRATAEQDVIGAKQRQVLTRQTHPSPGMNEQCDAFSICQPGCKCNSHMNTCGVDPQRKRGSNCVLRNDAFRKVYARKYEQPKNGKKNKNGKTNINFDVQNGYKKVGYFNQKDATNMLRDENDKTYQMNNGIKSHQKSSKPASSAAAAGDAGKLGIVFMTKDGTLQAPIMMYLAKVLQTYGYFRNVAEFHAAAYDQTAEWFFNGKLAKYGLPDVIVKAFANTETPPDFMPYLPNIWDAKSERKPIKYHYYIVADNPEEAKRFMSSRTQAQSQPNLLQKILGQKPTLDQATRSQTQVFGVIPYPEITTYNDKQPDLDVHLMFQRCIEALRAMQTKDRLWDVTKKRDWSALYGAQLGKTKDMKDALEKRALDLFSRQPRHHRCDDRLLMCKEKCTCDKRKRTCGGGCDAHQWVSFLHPDYAMALSPPIDQARDSQIASRINSPRKKHRAHQAYDDDDDDGMLEFDEGIVDEESNEKSVMVMFMCYALTMIIACLCAGCIGGAMVGYIAQKTKWIWRAELYEAMLDAL